MLKRAAGATAATAAAGRHDPSLPDAPAKFDENELRAAIGAAPVGSTSKRAVAVSRDGDAGDAGDAADAGAADDDDAERDPHRRRSPRGVMLAVLAIAAVLGTALLVLVGYLNSDRYLLVCESERAVPEQGRGFPPWGARALAGDAWRPLPIAAETRCQPLETDDVLVLQRAFLAMVLDQVTGQLIAHDVTKVDGAEALLKQALLLTRPPEHESDTAAKQRAEQHQEVERLLGDVAYWRASAKVRDAAAALGDAARQFDAAVAQHPRHVSDAGAWAAYVRKLAQELHAGPGGSTTGAAPPAAAGTAPTPATGPATTAGAPTSTAPASAAASTARSGSAATTAPPGAATTTASGGAATTGSAGAATTGSAGAATTAPAGAATTTAPAGAATPAAAGVATTAPATTATTVSPSTPSTPSAPAAPPGDRGKPNAPPAQPAAPPDAGTTGVLL